MPANGFDIPILIIVFNRVDTALEVFQRVRAQRPQRLFIAADGPRKGRRGEVAACEQVRKKLIESIDWPCETNTLFRESNLGCKYAVSGAIKWFFENVEMGIVLEDDCLPSSSFFQYCRVLLLHYRDDSKIGMISGHNYFGCTKEDDADYSMITTCGVWGWASWRRSLSGYDPDQSTWSESGKVGQNTICISRKAERILLRNSREAAQGAIDTWDYQFCDHLITHSMYTIMPSMNLIRNLGFSEESTHTQYPPAWYKDISYEYPNGIRIREDLSVNRRLSAAIERLHVPRSPSPLSSLISIARRLYHFLRFWTTFVKDCQLTLLRGMDGEVGERLRKNYYKRLGMRVGKDVRIDTGVFIYGAEHIEIGDRTHIDKNCILIGASEDLDLSKRVLKERQLECAEIRRGEIYIGKDCHISQNCMIYGYGGVLIEDNCVLSTGAKIYSLTSMPSDPSDPSAVVSIVPYEGLSPTLIGKVVLRNNVWVGIDSVVSPGLEIGPDSFVRSHAFVMKSFHANSYIAGDPAEYTRPRFRAME